MKTRAVRVGRVMVGADYPISIQTMWKKPLVAADEALRAEVIALESLGCQILRFAVPDMGAAEALGALASMVDMPLVADIHFDHRLALRCLDYPIAEIRINPGNIGSRRKVAEVAAKARDRGVAIRVGVNAGSLPRHLSDEPKRGLAMFKAAEEELEILDALGFRDVIVSLKSSDIESTVEANRLFAEKYDLPLHLGVTEAGPLIAGVVRSSLAFAELLRDGIGATVRVSLSDDCESEVIAAREILSALGKRPNGVRIVSCPRCGRAGFDVHGFLNRMKPLLYSSGKDCTVAVMGCVVNGPGEARHADIGITGSGDRVVIFRHGRMARTVTTEEAETAFREEFDAL